MPTKVIAWDFDGPINYTVPGPYPAHYTKTIKTQIYPTESRAKIQGEQPAAGDHPNDIRVNNFDFLKLTLQILTNNNVVSVIASQRIEMVDDADFAPQARDMFNCLDELFGADRVFLKRSDAEELNRSVKEVLQNPKYKNSKSNKSKNPYLFAIRAKYSCQHQHITLIDDNDGYKKPAEEEGYQFIHAPRIDAGNFDKDKDSSYLFEVLVKTILMSDIYRSLAAMTSSPAITAFKQALLQYQLDNLINVMMAQEVIMREKQLLKDEVNEVGLSEDDHLAKTLLTGIQRIIYDTPWEIGFMGGKKALHPQTNIPVILPTRIKTMLDKIIEASQGKNSWMYTLKYIATLGSLAAEKKSGSSIDSLSPQQLFYRSFATKDYMQLTETDKRHQAIPEKLDADKTVKGEDLSQAVGSSVQPASKAK